MKNLVAGFCQILIEIAFILYFIGFLRVFRELSDNIPKILQVFCYGYTIKILLTNCSFHTENIRILVFRTDVISFGPYFKTAVRIFCRMDLTIG